MGVFVRVYPDAWQSSDIQYLNFLAGQLQYLQNHQNEWTVWLVLTIGKCPGAPVQIERMLATKK